MSAQIGAPIGNPPARSAAQQGSRTGKDSPRRRLNPAVCQLPLAQRVAALSAPARAFHRALLQAFLAAGRAPLLVALRPVARQVGTGLERVLGQLVSHDVIQRAADGAIAVASPFSSAATAHWVHLTGAPPVSARCILDALGLPFMVGRPATIHTQDPLVATPITIMVEPADGALTWRPSSTVALANVPAQEPVIKAECSCPFVNAFARPESAERWRAEHPERNVHLLTQEQAVAKARTIVGALLQEPAVTE